MKERAIDLQLIKPVQTGSPGARGKITLKKLFKQELDRLNVVYSDPCCENNPDDGEQQLFGYRYNQSSWEDLNDFINTGATVNIDSESKLNFTGGASNYSQRLTLDDPTCIHNWGITSTFTVATVGSGVAIGLHSYNELGVNRWTLARFNTTTGLLSLGVGGSGVSGPSVFVDATELLTFSPTDILEIKADQRGYNFSVSIRNVTTISEPIICKFTFRTKFGSATVSIPNTSRITLWNLGGEFTINSLSWFVYEPKNAEMLIVGDSKSVGYYVSGHGQRYSDLLNNYYTNTINASGNGDSVLDVLHRVDEIVNLKPKRLLMAIGSNSIRHSLPNYIQDYDTIVSKATAAGIEVFHLIGFYEPTLNQSVLSNHIYSKYPLSNIIDCLVATTMDGLLVDVAHMNDLGNKIVADTIISSGKILKGSYTEQNVIRNQTENVQSASFNIDGSGELQSLKITGIAEYADNTAALTALLTIGQLYRTGDVLKIVH